MNIDRLHILQSTAWQNLAHFEDRATALPSLLQVYDISGDKDKRVIISELTNLIEQQHKLSTITPLLLTYFSTYLLDENKNRDILLSMFMRVAKAIAFNWEENRISIQPGFTKTLDTLSSIDSPLYIRDEQEFSKETILEEYNQKLIYFYTQEVLLKIKPLLENIPNTTAIENGLLYDLLTILKMIKPQERASFGPSFTVETARIRLRPIHPEDSFNLTQNLQGKTAQYLSFDPNGNQRLIDFYIDQSIMEQATGNALVLVIQDIETSEFLGSCALNDINDESVELGLWLKESAQGKGLGKHVVETMIKVVQDHVNTKYILYCVEEANEISIAIPKALGFAQIGSFILPPSNLKNVFRNMIEFRKIL